MNNVIVDAIRSRRRLTFVYNGRRRIAEPQCYGVGTQGTELLRVHQREPLFDVSKIEALTVSDETFATPGPNYRRDDSAMRVIFCQL